MAQHIDPEALEIITSDLIKPRMAAWFDKTKSVFLYQSFDQPLTIPMAKTHGVYIRPRDEPEFMHLLLRGEFSY